MYTYIIDVLDIIDIYLYILEKIFVGVFLHETVNMTVGSHNFVKFTVIKPNCQKHNKKCHLPTHQ